jgi:hypothetical protein
VRVQIIFFKEFKKLTTNPNNTWENVEVQMVNKNVKKCFISLAIKEMKIQMTLRFHLHPSQSDYHQENK